MAIDSEATETASENIDSQSDESDEFEADLLRTNILKKNVSEPNIINAIENSIDLHSGELIPALSNIDLPINFDENLRNEMTFEYISNVSRILKNEFDGNTDK